MLLDVGMINGLKFNAVQKIVAVFERKSCCLELILRLLTRRSLDLIVGRVTVTEILSARVE